MISFLVMERPNMKFQFFDVDMVDLSKLSMVSHRFLLGRVAKLLIQNSRIGFTGLANTQDTSVGQSTLQKVTFLSCIASQKLCSPSKMTLPSVLAIYAEGHHRTDIWFLLPSIFDFSRVSELRVGEIFARSNFKHIVRQLPNLKILRCVNHYTTDSLQVVCEYMRTDGKLLDLLDLSRNGNT